MLFQDGGVQLDRTRVQWKFNCQTKSFSIWFNGGGVVVEFVYTIANCFAAVCFANPSNIQSAVHVCFESRVADLRLLLNISINTDDLLRLLKVVFLIFDFFCFLLHLFTSSSLIVSLLAKIRLFTTIFLRLLSLLMSRVYSFLHNTVTQHKCYGWQTRGSDSGLVVLDIWR